MRCAVKNSTPNLRQFPGDGFYAAVHPKELVRETFKQVEKPSGYRR
jgi:hypothetical protein